MVETVLPLTFPAVMDVAIKLRDVGCSRAKNWKLLHRVEGHPRASTRQPAHRENLS